MNWNLEILGADWLGEVVGEMVDTITRLSPVEYNEQTRYIPAGVSPRPGYIRFDTFPYMREILECFAPESPVRECNVLKGVQTGYTTLLESILLYYIGHLKQYPGMFITADKELAAGRMENNIIPMLNESDLSHLIRSADEGNNRKTGKTKDFLQWDGGGFLIYNGAQNAAKMRQYSVPLMLKDEIDGWPRIVGKDGNADKLTDARLSAYWAVRKILRGSTPLTAPSLIEDAYLRGDQRKYLCLCKSCSYPQELRMENLIKDTGQVGGFKWETENGTLILDSVRFCCVNCGHEHFEHDKDRLFATEHGAHWKPTAEPKEYGIRSYHLAAFYSPYGFRPWYKCIADYLEGFDTVSNKVIDIGKYQEFYNNVLGKAFRQPGAKVHFTAVSAHRRAAYRYGEIPNKYASEHSGSPILVLFSQVDVHKSNLAVTVFGICRDSRPYLVDYWRLESDHDCRDRASPVWGELQKIIEEKIYTADDGKQYKIASTFIDANGPANSTVVSFCSQYASGVTPIVGRPRHNAGQKIMEFSEFETKDGSTGYGILVDHYKDRMSTVLRRQWIEGSGVQDPYHFNAPVDATDKQLKELTREELREETDAKGGVKYVWHRPSGADNELWDNLGYCYAQVEIIAYVTCIKVFELETIDWPQFWDYLETEKVYFTEDGA